METRTRSSSPPPLTRPKQKQSNHMGYKCLPRATTFTFPSLPFSPSQDPKPNNSGPSSGPIHLIPSVSRQGSISSIGAEPTSPEISCMGRIKKKKQKKTKHAKNKKNEQRNDGGDSTAGSSVLSRLLPRKKSTVKTPLPVTRQPTGMARRGRAKSLDGFDWTAAVRVRVAGERAAGKDVNLWKRRAVGPIKPLELSFRSPTVSRPPGCNDSSPTTGSRAP